MWLYKTVNVYAYKTMKFSFQGCTFLVIFGLPGYKHEQDCAHALLSAGRMKMKLDKMSGVK